MIPDYFKEWWYRKRLHHWVSKIIEVEGQLIRPEPSSNDATRYVAQRGNISLNHSPKKVCVDGKCVMEYKDHQWKQGYTRLNYGSWIEDIRDWYLEVVAQEKIDHKAQFERLD